MMMQPCYKTRIMLCNNAQQCTIMLQQQTIMWRWYCIDVTWCLMMCNIMFRCYNNVSMCIMMWEWYKHCYNVVQHCPIMFTSDQQCYIMLQHSDNAVTMMCNLLLRCDNNVTMYNNADPSYNNIRICSYAWTWYYNDMH